MEREAIAGCGEKDFGLRFHHLGVAVRKPTDTVQFMRFLGYEVGDAVYDPRQGVNLIMCRHAGPVPDVEIVYPDAARGKSPVDAFLRMRPDGLVYHVCYVTADLAGSLAALETAGLRVVCVAPPAPAVLFEGRRVSFYNIVGIGLCEILEL